MLESQAQGGGSAEEKEVGTKWQGLSSLCATDKGQWICAVRPDSRLSSHYPEAEASLASVVRLFPKSLVVGSLEMSVPPSGV